MSTLNRSAVRRDIDLRDDELAEIETLRERFTRMVERFARKHSGLPESHSQIAWRPTVEYFVSDFLDELFAERIRQLEADNEEDLFLMGDRA
jgi:hypothetical protein